MIANRAALRGFAAPFFMERHALQHTIHPAHTAKSPQKISGLFFVDFSSIFRRSST
jgi:hypothetical protein